MNSDKKNRVGRMTATIENIPTNRIVYRYMTLCSLITRWVASNRFSRVIEIMLCLPCETQNARQNVEHY